VKGEFAAADESLAAKFHARNISLENVKRAIALGCCRKYIALLNNSDSNPIFSFHYFCGVVEEILDPQFPAGYWDYLLPELAKLERKYLEKSR
jgi:hypothetical protein